MAVETDLPAPTTLKAAIHELIDFGALQVLARLIDMAGTFGSVIILAQAALQREDNTILAASGLISAVGTKALALTGAALVGGLSQRLHAPGADNYKKGGSVQSGWCYALLISAPTIAALLLLTGPVFARLGQNAEVLKLSEDFMRGYVWGIPFYLLRRSTATLFRLEKKNTRLISLLSGLQSVALISFSYLFVLSKLAKQASPTYGLGLANTAANGLTFTVCAMYLGFSKMPKNYSLFTLRSKGEYAEGLLYLIKKGSAIAAKVSVETGMMLATALMIGATGNASLAAHEIVVHYLRFAVPLYFMMGSVGADRIKARAKLPIARPKLGYAALLLSEMMALPFTLLFACTPKLLMRAFIDVDNPRNKSLVSVASTLFLINGVGLLCDVPRSVNSTLMRGFTNRDVNVTTLINLSLSFSVGLGLIGYVLGFEENMGAVGVTLGRASGWLLGAVALFAYTTLQFKKGVQDERQTLITPAP